MKRALGVALLATTTLLAGASPARAQHLFELELGFKTFDGRVAPPRRNARGATSRYRIFTTRCRSSRPAATMRSR